MKRKLITCFFVVERFYEFDNRFRQAFLMDSSIINSVRMRKEKMLIKQIGMVGRRKGERTGSWKFMRKLYFL